jgi:2-polyprenyl-6-methoxyphenol hydroxylase-like FAD-dependent oxidoreductase
MSLPSEGTVADADADAEVVIAGAGPVGCWLAAELSAAGVRVLVLEARDTRVSWSRGFIVHPRTLEIFDSRGVAASLVAAGRPMPTWHFAMGTHRLDFTALPTRFPYVLLHPQAGTEEVLEEHLNRCGGAVLRGQRVVGLTQEPDRVRVRVLHDGAERDVSTRFIVGCDGARSTVREAAGIGFSGNADTMVSAAALVELADPPPPERYMQTHEQGLFFAIPLPDGRFVVSTVDHAAMHDVGTPWTAQMMRASLIRVTGTDYGMGEAERVSTLGNAAKQADRYRDHRVLLAGDAAHVHFPMGGQGMNLGIHDAHNLAWRLIAAVRGGRAAPSEPLPGELLALLDGYETERRPAGERVLEDVRAQMALVSATGADGAALRARFEALLSEHPEVNLQYARRLSGLEVRYPAPDDGDVHGAGDARCGARVPDLELDVVAASSTDGTKQDPRRLYDLLRETGPGRHLRLTVMNVDADADTTPGTNTGNDADVPVVTVRRVLGPDWALRAGWGAAESVLIRPDGHVAGIRTAAGPRPAA